MNHLLDDIRALAVAEGARAEARWLTVGAVIDSVVEEVRPAAERHDVEVRVEKPDEDLEVDAVRGRAWAVVTTTQVDPPRK